MSPTIELQRTAHSRISERRLDQQSFGSVFSDHMLVADYWDGAWQSVRIAPYGPLSLQPSVSALHYGISVFEGQKAFRTVDDRVVLFRPDENRRRLARSCARLALPEVPQQIYLEGLRQLVQTDRAWVPGADEGSLYIRPCVFATDPTIRVRPPASCRLVVFTCPVGPYYAEPLKLLAATQSVRAFPGGTGDTKPAGNYAPTLVVEKEAQARGFHSVLWLDAREHRYVEEAGVMNVFFVIDGTVVTPNLQGTILPGITRDSVITLLKDMGVAVEERPVTMEEVVAAQSAGRLQECFGTGTAATISHVIEIGYHDQVLRLPPVGARHVGPAVLARLEALRSGREDDRFDWLMPV